MPGYWFPAKRRYGWGWALPITWQGWVVLWTFVACFGAGFIFFPPVEQTGPLLAYVFVLTAILLAICWAKGEPLNSVRRT